MPVKQKLNTVLICILYTLVSFFSAETSFAQQKEKERGYLSIRSNFDSLYVIIDDNYESVQKIHRKDLLEIEVGNHSVTVVPQYAPTFIFNTEVTSDTYYIATLRFKKILKEQNLVYSKIEDGQKLNLSERDGKMGTLTVSFTLEKLSKKDYIRQLETEKRNYYQNTYLKIISNADSVYVKTNTYSQKVFHVANKDSILIRPGYHQIRLSHQYAKEFSIVRKFSKGKTTEIEHDFELIEPSIATLTDNFATKEYYNANFIVVSDNDSKIIVNGTRVGTGATKLQMETGVVKVSIENPYTGTHTRTVENLPNEKATVIDAYTKPVKGLARFLGVFPGVSQIYKKQKLKSALFAGGFLILGGLTISSNNSYQSKLEEFNWMKTLYQKTTDEHLALEYGNLLDTQQDKVTKYNNKRIFLFGVTSLLYAFNLFDAAFSKPKSGYRTKTNLRLRLEAEAFQSTNYSSLSLKYEF